VKARIQHTLFCECGHALEFVGFEFVRCNQPRCTHSGKRFEPPMVDLAEIVAESPKDQLGEAIVQSIEEQAE
jgi:hypothetical protein